MAGPLPTGRIMRIAYNAANPTIRGAVISIVGYRGATHWDIPRIIVRLVNDDGSLGDEYLVMPSLVIAL